MAIRVERDPGFWSAVAADPAVAATMTGIEPATIGRLAARADFLPLAARHGGFLLQRRDELGLAWELHTLFTPAGWGREVVAAALEALDLLFGSSACLITTLEVRANARSRPWRGLGFARAGEWTKTPAGDIRLWILTKAAWRESRAAKRSLTCLH